MQDNCMYLVIKLVASLIANCMTTCQPQGLLCGMMFSPYKYLVILDSLEWFVRTTENERANEVRYSVVRILNKFKK